MELSPWISLITGPVSRENPQIPHKGVAVPLLKVCVHSTKFE
jgi:hypothetical protein